MNGYDIDGVLNKGYPADNPYVVISGRTIDEWERTVDEIGTDAPIYLRPAGLPGDEQRAGEWKAYMINLLKVDRFYEDSHIQASIIKMYCPKCEVIIV